MKCFIIVFKMYFESSFDVESYEKIKSLSLTSFARIVIVLPILSIVAILKSLVFFLDPQ